MQHRRHLLLAVLLAVASVSASGIGVSLSYLFPRDGTFSTPVPPLSIHDIGVTFGQYVGVSAGLSLYSLHGLALRSTVEPGLIYPNLIGPVYSGVASLAVKLIVPAGPVRITANAGGFGAYLIDMHTRDGGFDEIVRTGEGVTAVATDFAIDGSWGFGWMFGGSVLVKITEEFGLLIGANYYLGGAPVTISGSYTGDAVGAAPPLYLDNMSIDLSGLELSIGAELLQ
jgi:hypothetical protein